MTFDTYFFCHILANWTQYKTCFRHAFWSDGVTQVEIDLMKHVAYEVPAWANMIVRSWNWSGLRSCNIPEL
jgi:hypothetical protein